MIFSENKLNITLSGLRFNSEGIEEDLIKYLQIPVIKNPVKVINIKIIHKEMILRFSESYSVRNKILPTP